MKVIFTHRGGRQQRMPKQHAEVLRRLGRGGYETRVMVSAPQMEAAPPVPPEVMLPPVAEPTSVDPPVGDIADAQPAKRRGRPRKIGAAE